MARSGGDVGNRKWFGRCSCWQWLEELEINDAQLVVASLVIKCVMAMSCGMEARLGGELLVSLFPWFWCGIFLCYKRGAERTKR